MDFDGCITEELLGAYLSGDITAEERSAVETLLSDNADAREDADELRQLRESLSTNPDAATPELLTILRQRVFRVIADRQTSDLVGASLTGDVNTAERSAVDAFVLAHPEVRTQQKAFGEVLKLAAGAKPEVRSLVADELRKRLAAQLPVSAFAHRAGEGKSLFTPSMRVYLSRENFFRKRMAWVAAAALLLLGTSLSVWKIVVRLNRTTVAGTAIKQAAEDASTSGIGDESNQKPLPENVSPIEPQVAHREGTAVPKGPDLEPIVPPREQDNQGLRVVESPKTDPSTERVARDNTPKIAPDAPIARTSSPAETKTPVTQQDSTVPVPTPPQNLPGTSPFVNAPSVAINQNNPNRTSNVPAMNVANTSATTPSPANTTATSITPTTTTGNTGTTATSTGTLPPGVPVADNTSTTKTPSSVTHTPTAVTNTLAPVEGAAVIGSVKGNGPFKITGTDGQSVPARQKDSIPDGATVETGDGEMGLLLPGNGRLYVTKNSKFTITFKQHNTVLALDSGEIYYLAPHGGSLALTVKNDSLSLVNEADIAINAGQLVVSNFGTGFEFVTKVDRRRLALNKEGSSSLDGTDTVHIGAIAPNTGNWRLNVAVDGDSIKARKTGSASARK